MGQATAEIGPDSNREGTMSSHKAIERGPHPPDDNESDSAWAKVLDYLSGVADDPGDLEAIATDLARRDPERMGKFRRRLAGGSGSAETQPDLAEVVTKHLGGEASEDSPDIAALLDRNPALVELFAELRHDIDARRVAW